MINKYFQRELSHLRDLAAEFSKAHPALAPMLAAQSTDPDVERMLEGTAFLSGLVNEKLDDDFPQIVHSLTQLIFPHYLRPIPSTTVIQFTPKKSLLETSKVARGTELASREIEGTNCIFTTCYDVELHPLRISDVQLEHQREGTATLRIKLELTGAMLENWNPDHLRFHLAGSYEEALSRYYMLFHKVTQISLQADGEEPKYLRPSSLGTVGFDQDEALLPYPTRSFPGYRYLQEYFIQSRKFLFFDLCDLGSWKNKQGRNFEIALTIDTKNFEPPQCTLKDFRLFATPAINIFKHSATPIMLDHKRPEYKITPFGGNPTHYQVYSVDRVRGVEQGTAQTREYQRFEMFNPQTDATPVYTVNSTRSAIGDETVQSLSVAYPINEGLPKKEVISLDIHCTNASLASALQAGDICMGTDTSPELSTFENISQPTAPVQPPLEKNVLWRLLSHLYTNFLSIADADKLRSLIKIYIFTDTKDQNKVVANTKRVESIQSVTVTSGDRLVKGHLVRGQMIEIVLDREGFADNGDMYLFGCVLDRFIAGYAAVNCFTRLTVIDSLYKEKYTWPARLGNRPLV
ncbi:type VI secretion system baseplate subunit TssF [Halodesulfovibrio sp. MK-HDV]|uniref:type VI secretion system baseplate subunit TssF n=1 Tax=Halodesulfovibrio sp. MK-HDV TaxID=2599925 RepID=UPI001371D0F2|nr:type VI secretion system baseplate subunit TssF [Halodesulfovibrio sp. MK-HDV]KAF1077359.1 hypothetical protein MKHDV_00423 [Halodesulfovibrio sp. MK-HDV]